MAEASIGVEGYQAFLQKLKSFSGRIKDWSEAWPAFIKERFDIVQDKFWQARFAPLSTRYEARKLREHPFSPVLQATGRMKNAATRQGAEDSFIDAQPLSLAVGMTGRSGRIGRYHVEGTSRMPQRDFFSETEADIKRQIRPLLSEAVRIGRREGFITTTE